MFMVQSIAPMEAPSSSSTPPSCQASDTTASRGSSASINSEAASITRRQPWRAASAPASGIAPSEPSPRHSSTSPSCASSSPARSLAKGTIGAQVAMTKPGMKKAARVARCCARRGSWDKGTPGCGGTGHDNRVRHRAKRPCARRSSPSPPGNRRAAAGGRDLAVCGTMRASGNAMGKKMRSTLRIGLACAALALAGNTAAAAEGDFAWPQGQRAAVSLSYDDTLPTQLDVAIPALDRHGLKGSFYLTLAAQPMRERLDAWRAAARNGHELGNHSLFHQCSARGPGREWVQPAQDLDATGVAQMRAQLQVANTMLQAIDGNTEFTFTAPCGDRMASDGD